MKKVSSNFDTLQHSIPLKDKISSPNSSLMNQLSSCQGKIWSHMNILEKKSINRNNRFGDLEISPKNTKKESLKGNDLNPHKSQRRSKNIKIHRFENPEMEERLVFKSQYSR